jgi:hypothetical protein
LVNFQKNLDSIFDFYQNIDVRRETHFKIIIQNMLSIRGTNFIAG